MITPYQDSLLKFFRRLKWLGQSVPVVYAGPDRAHAQMVQYLAKRQASSTGKKVEEILKSIKEAAIPRPFISVVMDYAGYDPTRFSTHIHRGIVVDAQRGIALSVQEARPENFAVQADIWCGDDWHAANNLTGQLKGMFIADDLPLLVRFGDARYYKPPYTVPEHCRYMGDITCRFTDEGITDNSQTTGDTATPKDIRKTFSGTLYGWLPRVPFEVRLVKKFEYTVEDESEEPPVVLETTSIDFVID
jgi:hypothetical protein